VDEYKPLVTGTTVVYIKLLYIWSQTLAAPFLPFYAATVGPARHFPPRHRHALSVSFLESNGILWPARHFSPRHLQACLTLVS
jgi:hypothetical protein